MWSWVTPCTLRPSPSPSSATQEDDGRMRSPGPTMRRSPELPTTRLRRAARCGGARSAERGARRGGARRMPRRNGRAGRRTTPGPQTATQQNDSGADATHPRTRRSPESPTARAGGLTRKEAGWTALAGRARRAGDRRSRDQEAQAESTTRGCVPQGGRRREEVDDARLRSPGRRRHGRALPATAGRRPLRSHGWQVSLRSSGWQVHLCSHGSQVSLCSSGWEVPPQGLEP
jgi:hypothetical protein